MLLALGLTIGAAGCTITPLEEVQSPTPVPVADDQPQRLAFDETDDVDAADTVPATTDAVSSSTLLDEVDAAPWTQITDSARIGVHSAPDVLYTRLGVLEPGAGVLATGRRVETNDVVWMEIRWDDTTAWVIQTGFAPAE
jgi:hypothetical protein